jgi:hypothetical protein
MTTRSSASRERPRTRSSSKASRTPQRGHLLAAAGSEGLPLYDGTVWSITLQTFKVAQQAAAKQAAQEEKLARLQTELDAARARIAELETGKPASADPAAETQTQ